MTVQEAITQIGQMNVWQAIAWWVGVRIAGGIVDAWAKDRTERRRETRRIVYTTAGPDVFRFRDLFKKPEDPK